MSTAIVTSTSAQLPTHGKSMFWRFVWKEFRMIRSLWLAVAVMGLLVQFAEKMLLPGESDFVLALLCTGLAAAVLYAAGAAATTFSVEHEEETYDLLTRLPTIWWPPFAGKLVVTLLSALLLGTVLSISALILGGRYFISGHDAQLAIGMLGFAILEAVAWGTLFSLLIKRPLLAAIVTLVVGTVTVNIAVSYSSTYAAATLSPEAYVHAIPLRAAIVVAVIACSVFVARGWLNAGARPGMTAHLRKDNRFMTWLAGGRSRTREVKAAVRRVPHRRMLARLLWQTWRENWRLLLVPLAVGLFLLVGIGAILSLANLSRETSLFAITAVLLVPALYGAMTFHSDQRRRSVNFLAEHAARPRYVWFARNLVWLGSLITVSFLLAVLIGVIAIRTFGAVGYDAVENTFIWGHNNYPGAPYILYEGCQTVLQFARGASSAIFALLTAYSIGQFCSMAIRSEILAALISLILSVFVAAAASAIAAWHLSPWLFLLSVCAGCLLATWLRTPDWIAGRNSIRSWIAPAAAIAAPLVVVALLLPGRRLAQLSPTIGDNPRDRINVAESITEKVSSYEGHNTAEARATADMYVSAAEHLDSGEVVPNPLDRWFKREYMSGSGPDSEIDAKKIPPAELPAFHAAKEKFDTILHSDHGAMALAIAASKRYACRFHFELQPGAPLAGKVAYKPNVGSMNLLLVFVSLPPIYEKVDRLIDYMIGEDASFDQMLAAMRTSANLRRGQPTYIFIDQLYREQRILQRIADWAFEEKRTKTELETALISLYDTFRISTSPESALLADHVRIQRVIAGQESPLILAQTPVPLRDQLAFMANELPWERRRALQALDRITYTNTLHVEGLVNRLRDPDPHQVGTATIRQWLRSDWGSFPPVWQIEQPAAATSYLASYEYEARVPISKLCRACCDNEVLRRGTLLQIGLAMYRLDHKEYPPQLSRLVPDYLPEMPLDPYSSQQFGYEPAGLNLLLMYDEPYSRRRLEIEPHTPFIWSVGIGDVRLKQIRNTSYEPIDKVAIDNGTRSVTTTYYELQLDEFVGWSEETYAFALRKGN